MRIRPAVAADVPGIQLVGLLSWPPTYWFAGPDYVAAGLARWWSVDALHGMLSDLTCLVATDDDGRIVGITNLDISLDPPVIWKLYVRPDAQGRGVGSALLHAVLAARPAGTDAVRLEYTDGNTPAAAFYRRHGLIAVGRTHHPDGPDEIWLEWRASGRQ